MIFHCLFEQSGTFKNMFKQHGHQAFDYDISNGYKQTDYKIDLFREIDNAWDKIARGKNTKSIFDNMRPGSDFIIAFFPCTYFTYRNELVFQGHHNVGNKDKLTALNNIDYIIKREFERAEMYERFLKFCFVVQELKIPTIIENPAGRNYLRLFSPFRPVWIDEDRSLYGDDKIKPTMFFALNFEMQERFMMFDQSALPTKTIRHLSKRKRSEISPRYAENFYQRFLGGVL